MTTAVAMALYNGEKYIEKQLDCIRLQTKRVDKVIMCDDGSKDDTARIVNQYIEKYNLSDTWLLFINEQNLGYIQNFYKAMSLCDEEIIFLADQDDVWELDKVEKMTKIMNDCSIALLSSRYGIIDSTGKKIKTIMHKDSKESMSCKPIRIIDIMRSYNWPGMAMCIRKDLAEEVYKGCKGHQIPHDLALAIIAADQEKFYEYDYIGVHHRRHNNNTAREEHRIFKLLNRERKENEITETRTQLLNIINAKLSLKEDTASLIKYKAEYLGKRLDCLKQCKIMELFKLYKNVSTRIIRPASFLCDLWIVTLGRNTKL